MRLAKELDLSGIFEITHEIGMKTVIHPCAGILAGEPRGRLVAKVFQDIQTLPTKLLQCCHGWYGKERVKVSAIGGYPAIKFVGVAVCLRVSCQESLLQVRSLRRQWPVTS